MALLTVYADTVAVKRACMRFIVAVQSIGVHSSGNGGGNGSSARHLRSTSDRQCSMLADVCNELSCAAALLPAGVLFNPLMPEWLQTAMLAVLLVVVVRKTYAKGFKQWSTEKSSKQQQPGHAPNQLRIGPRCLGALGAQHQPVRWPLCCIVICCT